MNKKDKSCPHCDYKTSEGFNLRIHIARVHEGKKFKAECPYCNKSVVSLNWHLEKYHKKMVDDKLELTQLVNQQDMPIEHKLEEIMMIPEDSTELLVGHSGPKNNAEIEPENGEELQAFDYSQAFLHENLYKSQT